MTLYQDETPVLHNVNFNINKGEFVYLVGRTGSGKSSLLSSLIGDMIYISDNEVEAFGGLDKVGDQAAYNTLKNKVLNQ